MVLNEDWTADVKGRMHRFRISNAQLAEEAEYAPAYVSTVLNGGKHFENDESKERTKDRILQALERLESAILAASSVDGDAANAD